MSSCILNNYMTTQVRITKTISYWNPWRIRRGSWLCCPLFKINGQCETFKDPNLLNNETYVVLYYREILCVLFVAPSLMLVRATTWCVTLPYSLLLQPAREQLSELTEKVDDKFIIWACSSCTLFLFPLLSLSGIPIYVQA